MSKEDFKLFVKDNPFLITKVKNNETTWQKLFEIYSLYGDNQEAWNNYFAENKENDDKSFKEILSFVKNVDLNKLKQGVDSLSKAVGLLQGLGKEKEGTNDLYQPRENYQHYDD